METKSSLPSIDETIAFIQSVHTAVDWGGAPYWQHPVAVMDLLPRVLPGQPLTHSVRLKALLHDVVEDTDETAETLLARGYSEDVVASVLRLSRPPRMPYLSYLEGLTANGEIEDMWVKLADSTHNTDPQRLLPLSSGMRVMARSLETKRYIPGKALLRARLAEFGLVAVDPHAV